jgi:hypothetical protein
MHGASNNLFTNSGTIAIGSSTGMVLTGGNNIVTNAGTISSTVQDALAIYAFGNGNAVTNSGAITLTGTSSIGIFAAGNGNMILNSGTITVGGSTGDDGVGVSLRNGNTLTNTGSIVAAGAYGMAVGIWGDGNTVTNTGLISATSGAGVSILGINNTIVNNGTIRAGANGYALQSLGATGNRVINNGTMDGQIFFDVSNSLSNAGLITITDPGTALAAGNLHIGGTFTQTARGTLALRLDNAGLHDGLVATNQLNLDGTLRAVLQPGLYGSSTTYKDVLVAGSPVNGRFATVTASLAFFSVAATYNVSSVDLTLTRYGFGGAPGETPTSARSAMR